jgi:hypothetical protein
VGLVRVQPKKRQGAEREKAGRMRPFRRLIRRDPGMLTISIGIGSAGFKQIYRTPEDMCREHRCSCTFSSSRTE